MQQFVNALALGCAYGLFALGFTLIFGILDVVDLSYGAVFMVGAYVSWYAVSFFHLDLWVALVAAFCVAGLLSALIDQLVLRPLRRRGAPHLIPMIATIGIGIMLTNGAQEVFGASNHSFPLGVMPSKSFVIMGAHVGMIDIVVIALSIALMVALIYAVKYSRFGRSLRAVAESPKASRLLGINVEGVFVSTRFFAGGLGGVAGVLLGLSSDAIYPVMGESMLLIGISVVIVGGLGSIAGAVLGGLFIAFSQVLSIVYLGSENRNLVAFGLLFLVLIVRPQGLLGRPAQRKA